MPRPQFTDLLPMGRAASFFTFTTVSLAPNPTTAAPAPGRPMEMPMVY